MTDQTTSPDDARGSVVRLARLIRDERERKGWSQRALARAAGLNHETLRRIESAQIDPRLSVALRLLNALDLVKRDTLSRICA